jgi:catechol 2,3-dioxygenase-like lactoylglutathione lyase family enzyme
MDDALTELFDEFDHGRLSRRQLLQALGLAAVGAAVPVRIFGQGRCGGARAGQAGCDTIPAKAPFEPTGWKTVYMDHFTMQAADYKKEVGYYAALMNWTVRSDDGTKAVLDMGDAGTVVIRGGYQAPAPPPPPAGGDSAAGRGRGGRGGGGQRMPANVVWDSFCWGIEPWSASKVETELKKRGLNPVRGNDGPGGNEYFMVTDPGGFTLKISDGSKRHRRSGEKSKVSEPEPFEHTNWHTLWLDHISFNCPNYKASTAFYQALLGWKPTGDEGSQNETEIGDLGNIIIRGGGPPRPGATVDPNRKARIDHIAFGITPWDTDAVANELLKRGLTKRDDTGGKGDIHDAAALYKSYHTTTPNGFDLQISNANKANRTVR